MPAYFFRGRGRVLNALLLALILLGGCGQVTSVHDFSEQAQAAAGKYQFSPRQYCDFRAQLQPGDSALCQNQDQRIAAFKAKRDAVDMYLGTLTRLTQAPPGDDPDDTKIQEVIDQAYQDLSAQEAAQVDQLGSLCLGARCNVLIPDCLERLVTRGNAPFQAVVCSLARSIDEEVEAWDGLAKAVKKADDKEWQAAILQADPKFSAKITPLDDDYATQAKQVSDAAGAALKYLDGTYLKELKVLSENEEVKKNPDQLALVEGKIDAACGYRRELLALPDASQRNALLAQIKKNIEAAQSYYQALLNIAHAHAAIYEHRRDLWATELSKQLKTFTSYLKHYAVNARTRPLP